MAIKKLTVAELNVGDLVLAYSARSRKLSSNGTGGIVACVKSILAGHVTVSFLKLDGTADEVTIRNYEERQDAWAVPLQGEEVDGQLQFQLCEDESSLTSPSYSDRMWDLVYHNRHQVEIVSVVSPERLANMDVPHKNFHRVVVRTSDGNSNTKIHASQLICTTDVAALVCSAQELERKKAEERIAKAKAMLEGGVKLTVGKPQELGRCVTDIVNDFTNTFDPSNKRATSYFGAVNSNGKLYKVKTGACHAGLKDLHDYPFVISSIRQLGRGDTVHNSIHVCWFDYLANRSPYKDFFITKDAESMVDTGTVIVHTNGPSNALSSLMTATRHIYEYPARCAAFQLLREHMPENMAFFISLSAAGQFTDEGMLSSLTFNNNASEHTAMSWNTMSDEGIMSFCAGVAPNQNDTLKENNEYFTPHRVWALFEPKGDSSRLPSHTNFFTKSLPKIKALEGDKSDNPFEIQKSSVDKSIEKAVALAYSFLPKDAMYVLYS